MVQQPFTTSFGRQVASPRPSSPAFGFGSATRAQSARVHQPSLPGEETRPRSPGPIYKQGDGASRAREVSYSFGGSPRFHESDHTTVSPGPHALYSPYASLGGNEQRSNKESPRRHGAPPCPLAPSASSAMPLMLTRPFSFTTTSPRNLAAGFGTATRAHRQPFVTNAHHRADLYGRGSPGPGERVTMKGSFGVQRSSTKETAPACIMTSGAGRFDSWEERRSRAQPAAPGSHELASSVGVQRDSRRPSSPQATMSRARPQTLAKVYLHSKDRTSLGHGSPGPSAYNPTRAFAASRPPSAAFSFGTASRFPTVGNF